MSILKECTTSLEVSRRNMIMGSAASLALINFPSLAMAQLTPSALSSGNSVPPRRPPANDTFLTKDGTRIYFRDWGSGTPVVFSHGWPLNADSWDAQMLFLGQRGYRVIAHDRRGHGRSEQSWHGNDIDTYADDLAQLIETLDLTGVMLVGHSTGGGEVTRYVGRHGSNRLAKLVLISAIPPLRLENESNPGGAPLSAFNDLRATVRADRSQFLEDLSIPFFGYNRPGSKASEGVRNSLWQMGMQASIVATFDGIKTQSETDFTDDLNKIDIPTLIIHGQEDQLVPVADSALLNAKLIKHSTLSIYDGAPHGLIVTHASRVNDDLLAFVKE